MTNILSKDDAGVHETEGAEGSSNSTDTEDALLPKVTTAVTVVFLDSRPIYRWLSTPVGSKMARIMNSIEAPTKLMVLTLTNRYTHQWAAWTLTTQCRQTNLCKWASAQ